MRRLHLHPDSRCEAVQGIEAEAVLSPSAGLLVRYVLTGDIRALLLPLPSGSARADGLWRHTCFELFLRARAGNAYCEFNFATSLRWAAYHFDDYRRGMRELDIRPPGISIRQDGISLELQAVLASDGLTGPDGDVEQNLALSAVIEDINGNISYWALAHPAGKPDFHHADAFVLSLPAETSGQS